MLSDKMIEMLMDTEEEGISDCCSAEVISNICTCCHEICNTLTEEDEDL